MLLLLLSGLVRSQTAPDITQNEIFTQKPSSSLSNLSDLELRVAEMTFTWEEYAADIPENSVGRVYVTPREASARHRMGIQLVNDTLGKQVMI